MNIVRGALLEKQERCGVGNLASFANARVLLAAGTSRLASQRNLFRSKRSLNGTANMRHDLRNAGRCGSTPAETQAPRPRRQPRLPPRPQKRKEEGSRNTSPMVAKL